jgi:hypothetical protein
MLESNVSVGDTCKEIGVTRHDSDDAVTEQKHNAEFLAVISFLASYWIISFCSRRRNENQHVVRNN